MENARGDVVGDKTFGSGSIQKVIDMPDGSALILSVAKYYSPSGKALQDTAVTPNILVADNNDDFIAPDEDENAAGRGAAGEATEGHSTRRSAEQGDRGAEDAGLEGLIPLPHPSFQNFSRGHCPRFLFVQILASNQNHPSWTFARNSRNISSEHAVLRPVVRVSGCTSTLFAPLSPEDESYSVSNTVYSSISSSAIFAYSECS